MPASQPQVKPVRKRAIPQAGDVITRCGCVCVPWPVIHILGVKGKSVLCDMHGWQAVVRPASLQERAGLGEPQPVPDEPLY